MKFKTQGAWKKFEQYPNTRAICLQMVIAKEMTKTKNQQTFAGVVGGYCGSDLFLLEQFLAKTTNGKLTSLWIGSEDCVNNQEIDFCSLDENILVTCHQALEECWDWNSENNWLEGQQLRLYPYNLSSLKNNKGLLQTPKEDPILSSILRTAGDYLGLVNAKIYMDKPKNSDKPTSKEEKRRGNNKNKEKQEVTL
jgi:hypothetical protein